MIVNINAINVPQMYQLTLSTFRIFILGRFWEILFIPTDNLLRYFMMVILNYF